MSTPLIAYPFQITGAGTVATVDDGSDVHLAQELAVAVLTRAGERTLVPEFGIADPVFVGFEADALRLHVETFGPPVVIDDVEVTYLDDRTQDVAVYFDADLGG